MHRRPPGSRPSSPRASYWLRRAAERTLHSHQTVQSELLARLLEVGDLSTFLAEVARGARVLTQAHSSEMVLDRTPPSIPGKRPQRRRPLPAVPRRASRRVQDGHSVLSHSAGTVAMLVPVRHAGRTFGCLRLAWLQPPSPRRLAALRRYLAHAGAALARIVAEERLMRQHRRYEALLDSLPDACLLILSPEAVVSLDWHNDMSRLLLDINDEMERAADDRARGVVIRRLRRALEDKT